MANKVQKFAFNLSTLSPILFFYAIVWWLQMGMNSIIVENGKINVTPAMVVVTTMGIIGVLYSFYSCAFVKICRDKLERVTVKATSVEPCDTRVIGVVVTYILPFATFVIKDLDLRVLAICGMIILLLVCCANTVIVNPLLMIRGYHFYELSNIDGGNGFSLISRHEKIGNAQLITSVICAFDYLLIDVG